METARRLVDGHYAVPPPIHTHHGGTSAIRLRRIEPFVQDAHDEPPASDHNRQSIEKRRSLSDMDYSCAAPVVTLLSASITSGPSDSGVSRSSTILTARPSPHPPTDVIESIRAKTLLDYDFMRQFSLAKRKPLGERNLSRMSASSVYSMRMAQMELEQQAARLQRIELPPAKHRHGIPSGKAEDDTRAAASTVISSPPVVASTSNNIRSNVRRFRAMRSVLSTPLQGDSAGSTCFPTLWTPNELAHTSGETVKPILTLKYRQPQPKVAAVVEDNKPTSHPRAPSKRNLDLSSKATNQPIISDGLSEFDLRKCHPTSIVTAQHGYLQDQDLPALLNETGYDRAELYALWARFKALCAIAKSPKGIDKETFRRGIPQLSVEDEFFIDRVFDILDADGSGILEWQEFVDALSALEKGDVTKRVEFLFRVYDLNGDGSSIHRNEVMQFLLASLLVQTTDELVDVAKHFVGKIFEAAGCGDKDTMKVEDALRYMKEHPSADIYSLFGRTMVTKHRAPLEVANWDDSPISSGSPKKSISHSRTAQS